jgi:hypothetical protein
MTPRRRRICTWGISAAVLTRTLTNLTLTPALTRIAVLTLRPHPHPHPHPHHNPLTLRPHPHPHPHLHSSPPTLPLPLPLTPLGPSADSPGATAITVATLPPSNV